MTSIGESLADVLNARPFPAKVAAVTGQHLKLVINRGSKDGVKMGQRFLVYGFGDDIKDPESGRSLGRLEIVRGTGVVVHLQDLMATVRSDRYEAPQKRIVKTPTVNLFTGSQEETIVGPSEALPFELPEVGDLVKPI